MLTLDDAEWLRELADYLDGEVWTARYGVFEDSQPRTVALPDTLVEQLADRFRQIAEAEPLDGLTQFADRTERTARR